MADVADKESARETDIVNEILGDLLRQLRVERDMTQSDVAERADISRGSVANVERGEQGVSVTLLLRLAAALDSDPSQLIARTQEALAERPVLDQVEDRLRQSLDERELLWVLPTLGEKSA